MDGGGDISSKAIAVSRGLHPQENLQALRTEEAKKDIQESLVKEGARPLVVAAYQMWNHCDGEEGKRRNLERMCAAIVQAKAEGVQLMAFPEMCLQGYFTPVAGTVKDATAANRALADAPGDSVYLKRLQEKAAEARMVLVFGFAEQAGDKTYNSAGVIDSDGQWLGTRRKNPLYPWPYEQESFSEPERAQRSTVFDTSAGRIGVSICFDGEFAESVRQMRFDGAEVLVWINAACGDAKLGTAQRLNAAGAYAHGNNLWVVCCNCAAPDSSGTTCIYPPCGEPLTILSPGKEEIGIATLNLAMNKDWSIWKDRVLKETLPQNRA